MKNFKKCTLTFTVAALICTPLLHCEDATSQTPSTGKLQSVINYVKNIRKPLTPQEKLVQCITRIDVAGFKNTYKSFQNWTPDDRAATLQALTITAQEFKQALQDELESVGGTTNKTMLAKSVAQTVLGIYCTLATMFSLAYKGEAKFMVLGKRLKKDNLVAVKNRNNGHFISSLMFYYLFNLAEHPLTRPIVKLEKLSAWIRWRYSEKLAALTNIIVTPLTGYVAYNSLQSGIKNLKNGWDYKAYLKRQIKNIDKINAYIQKKQK